VVVRSVDERDAHRRIAESPRRRKPTKAAAEDHDVRAFSV
jgi:hypothetical protein